MKGLVHSIEAFGTVDGPGIRMVFFLTGCPMNCNFCHNPEIAWGKSGSLYTPEDLLAEYNKYRSFYETGGVTFSGGEPLYQADFLLECAKLMRENNIHVTVDTSLACGEHHFQSLTPYVDLWMVSIKAISPELHLKLSKRENKTILDRIKKLNRTGANMLIRYVIIPRLTDDEQELTKLANFIVDLENPVDVELLAYHSMGVRKWEEMGLTYELTDIPDADNDALSKAKDYLKSCGVSNFLN